MNSRTLSATVGALFLLAATTLLNAQSETNIGDKYSNRYSKEVFTEADTDKDGYISREEAKGASRQVERDLYGSERFHAADRNGDDRLSPQEVNAYLQKERAQKESGSTKLKHQFGDETESPETPRTHEDIAEKYSDRYSKEFFMEADTDQDGYITREEAKAASRQTERELYGGKRFRAADLDEDGRLSREEVRAYRMKEMSQIKQRKGSEGTEGIEAGRKRASKQKRFEEASRKRENENPRMNTKQINAKKRRQTRDRYGAGD
jgi:Ca2+-binding EF-hand superfamily protein